MCLIFSFQLKGLNPISVPRSISITLCCVAPDCLIFFLTSGSTNLIAPLRNLRYPASIAVDIVNWVKFGIVANPKPIFVAYSNDIIESDNFLAPGDIALAGSTLDKPVKFE